MTKSINRYGTDSANLSELRFDLMIYSVSRHFQQYFSYIVVVSFSGGGNRSIQRKPPTCH